MGKVHASIVLAAVITLCVIIGLFFFLRSDPSTQELDADLSAIQTQLAEANAEAAKYEGGLLLAFIDLRREILKATQVMLEQKRSSVLRRVNLEYTVASTQEAPATPEQLSAISTDIAKAQAQLDAEKIEADRYSGGLLQVMALATITTHRLTLAQLNLSYYGAKYGLKLPALKLPPMPDQGKLNGDTLLKDKAGLGNEVARKPTTATTSTPTTTMPQSTVQMGLTATPVNETGDAQVKSGDTIPERERSAYIDKIKLYDFDARYHNSVLDGRVPGVTFKLKNEGDKTLKRVEVTVYFKDAKGNVITEEKYLPVLVSEYAFGQENAPLKPGYIWQIEKDKFYPAKSVPSEWNEGSAVAAITSVDIADSGSEKADVLPKQGVRKDGKSEESPVAKPGAPNEPPSAQSNQSPVIAPNEPSPAPNEQSSEQANRKSNQSPVPSEQTPAKANQKSTETISATAVYVIQVGIKQSQTEALAAFADMQLKYPSLLAYYRPMVQKADLGAKGVWYRLRIGPINDKTTALKLCTQLKSQRLPDCMVMAAR